MSFHYGIIGMAAQLISLARLPEPVTMQRSPVVKCHCPTITTHPQTCTHTHTHTNPNTHTLHAPLTSISVLFVQHATALSVLWCRASALCCCYFLLLPTTVSSRLHSYWFKVFLNMAGYQKITIIVLP